MLLQTNLPIPPGAQISLTNLMGVTTPNTNQQQVLVGKTNVKAIWNRGSHYLTFEVPENETFVQQPTKIRFVLRNSGSAQVAPTITVKVTGWAPASIPIEKVAVGSGIVDDFTYELVNYAHHGFRVKGLGFKGCMPPALDTHSLRARAGQYVQDGRCACRKIEA